MYKNQKTRKIKVTRKAIVVFVCIFVVLIVLITGIVMISTRSKDFEETLITLPFDDTATYFSVNNSIVYYEDDILTCISPSLSIIWQKRLFSSGLNFVYRDDKIAATGQGVLQVVDAQGLHLFSTQLDGDIISARICNNKVAVYVEQPTADETLSYIIIFDLSGIFLYQIEVTNSYILDYGFDYSSDLLYLLELDISGVAPISRISTYRPETESMTSVKELKDQLVDQLYIIDGTVYALGTNQLIVYTSLGENEKEIVIYGWMQEEFYMLGDPKFVYIPSNTDKNGIDIVRIIEATGDEITINLPPDVFKVLYIQEKIYCFTQTNIYVYSGDGKFLRSFEMPFGITDVTKAFGSFVYIIVDQTVYLMPLS